MKHDAWPPKRNVVATTLSSGERDAVVRPASREGPTGLDSYISDPANPVPYRPRPIELRSGWTTWLVEDQRFVHGRPDVLAWVSEPLKDDLIVSGKIVANLFASTTGTDSDWIVKFIDVFPEKYEADPKLGGYQLMIAAMYFVAATIEH